MKFGISVKRENFKVTDGTLEDLVGLSCGKTRIRDIIPFINESRKEQDCILCCEGSFLEYLENKKFHGKDNVFRFDW